jgi:4-azaleucine resistance transporter AzlC
VQTRRSLIRDCVVLGMAVGVFGVSFGVLAAGAGLGVAKSSVMSLLVFTGASQFAAVGVVVSGGSQAAAVGSALLLAGRNAAYGMAMSPLLQGGTGRRLAAAQLSIDESAAMATAQQDPGMQRLAFWATGASVYVFWNLGTVLGAVAGSAIGDPEAWGLDAAFPAGFVALVVPHLRHRRGRVAGLLGGLVAACLVPLAPPGVPILVAAAVVLPVVLLLGPEPVSDGRVR